MPVVGTKEIGRRQFEGEELVKMFLELEMSLENAQGVNDGWFGEIGCRSSENCCGCGER